MTATKTGLAKARQAVDFAYEAMQSEMLRTGGSSSDATTARTIRDAAAEQRAGLAAPPKKVHALADVNAKANAEALEDAKKDLEKLSKKVEKIPETTKKPPSDAKKPPSDAKKPSDAKDATRLSSARARTRFTSPSRRPCTRPPPAPTSRT